MNRRPGITMVLAIAALTAGGCRRGEDREAADERASIERPITPSEAPSAEPERGAYLDGALLEARYDSSALAELARSTPRPSPTGSPLVEMFGAVVDHFLGEPQARLAAVGLQPDASIHLSIRALDGRAAAVRKLLGELASDQRPAPDLVAQLSSEARTLGVHLRASLPTSDPTKLLRALELLTITDDDAGAWADACATLEAVALCSGRPRVLLWARPEPDVDAARVRVDAVYLFHAGARPADLARALARADGWPGRATPPDFGPAAPLELRIHADPTRVLLEAEAIADAAIAFAGEGSSTATFDWDEVLDREQALRDLVPARRVFEGLDLDVRYAADEDRLGLILRWLIADQPAAPLADLFAPIVERGTLPVIRGDCAMARACARIGGLSSLRRFVPLAYGPFADMTGATRVLRQAGDRGTILLALSSWPNLLGTGGAMTQPGRGLMSQTAADVIGDSYGFGLYLLELGAPAWTGEDERFVAWLRVGPDALDALRGAASLAGVSPRPVRLADVDADVEQGSYDGVPVFLVDETPRRAGFGGWMLAADGDSRVGWLLDTPREPTEPTALDPVWYLQIASLGPIAAREDVAFSDDPPVRSWLDGRGLELRGTFEAAAGVRVEIELSP